MPAEIKSEDRCTANEIDEVKHLFSRTVKLGKSFCMQQQDYKMKELAILQDRETSDHSSPTCNVGTTNFISSSQHRCWQCTNHRRHQVGKGCL